MVTKLKNTVKPLYIIAALCVTLLLYGIIQVNKSEVDKTKLSYWYQDYFINANSNLMLGSSSIKRLAKNQMLNCGPWLNRGIGRSTIADINHYLRLTPLRINPKHILLYLGENDLYRTLSLSQTQQQYTTLLKTLSARFPQANIHVLALKHSPKRRAHWSKFTKLNNALSEFSAQHQQLYFHPFAQLNSQDKQFLADGVHLTNAGYMNFLHHFNESCSG